MLLGSYPNALCLTYSVVESPHLRALAWNFLFFFCRHTDGDTNIFPHTHLSFPGDWGRQPPKRKAANTAASDWDFGTQSPCLLYHRTHINKLLRWSFSKRTFCSLTTSIDLLSTSHGHSQLPLLCGGNYCFFLWVYLSGEPTWLCFYSETVNLSHISTFWLNRTFQDHQEHLLSPPFRFSGSKKPPGMTRRLNDCLLYI